MKSAMRSSRNSEVTRERLVAAARGMILERGFTGSGVDQICERAGVTKGAFFHHFKSKDEIGKAALADWAAMGMGIYAQAKSEPARHPLEPVHRMFDIMIRMIREADEPVTCVVGIMSQELANANPSLREACSTYLADWTEFVRQLLEDAKAACRPRQDFDAAQVAWFLNSLWQGSMLVSKTLRDPQITIANLKRARAYVDSLFGEPARQESPAQNL